MSNLKRNQTKIESVTTDALFAEERRSSMVSLLHELGKVTVEDLVRRFSVSAATVRSDLARLENDGLLRRTHGGAIPAIGALFEPVYQARSVLNLDAKCAIAEAASRRIQDGETILLDAGTTCYALARKLAGRRNVTVVTNSLSVIQLLGGDNDPAVVVIGGELQRARQAMLGPAAMEQLARLRVDRAFLSVNGVDAEHGLTVVDFTAAESKRRMAACAEQTVVLADATKLGRTAFVRALDLEQVQVVVTEAGDGDGTVVALRERGVLVECV